MNLCQSLGIEQRFQVLGGRIDSRSRLFVLLCHAHDLFHRSSSIFRLDRRGCSKVALNSTLMPSLSRSWNRQQIGIALLHAGYLLSGLHRSLQTLVVKTIRRRASSLAIESNANRNHVALFSHVLMNRVVCKARERVAPARDDRFNLASRREFLNTREDIVNLFLREHVGVENRVSKPVPVICASSL